MIECSQLVGPDLGKDLASNELTSVRKIRKTLTVPVYRGHIRRLYSGVLVSLNELLHKYDERLNGVLMSFDRLTLEGKSHRVQDQEDISVTVTADFYVFYPLPGIYLTATVSEKKLLSTTALVHKTFQLKVRGRLESKYEVGAEMTVKILSLAYTEDRVPEMVGEVVSRTRRQIMAEERERSIQTLLSTKDDELTGLEAVRMFKKGDPVVEYVGKLVSLGKSARVAAATQREENDYNFYFCSGGFQYCIDASEETGRFGRLVNHSIMDANTEAKVVVVKNVPRLTLFALTDIKTGQEILYDYGDRDPETRAANTWLCL